MKIKKFIKKNYKKLIIQFVSIISAFVIFTISCMAESNQQIIDGTKLWFTNCSLNSNVTENSLGVTDYYIDISNVNYWTGDTLADYEHTGMWAQYLGNDSVPWRGRCYVATVLLPESISIKKEQSYTIEIPLVYIFGDSETEYALETNLLRISLWDNSGDFGNGTFDFYSNDTVRWSPTYYRPMEDTTTGQRRIQNKVKIELSNHSNKNYNVNYILVAFRISNGVNLYPTSGFGIYDDIIVTNNGKVYKEFDNSIIQNYDNLEQQVVDSNKAGINSTKEVFNSPDLFLNFGRGLLAVTEIFNCFAFDGTWLSSVLDISLLLGLFAFIVGMSVLIVKSGGKK